MAELTTRIIIKNDSSANWLTNKSHILLKGETAYEFLDNGKVKMKVGDGVKTWEELDYFGGEESHVYEATLEASETKEQAISRVVGSATPVTGDIAIVKALIAGEKYEYTGYVYNGTTWAAMDGNYNAKNIIFDTDLMFTRQFGKFTPDSSGSVTLPTSETSLYALLMSAYSEEKNPTTTQPSVSVTLTEAKGYEVGTTVTPNYKATFNEGDYSYKPDSTGVTVSAWEITDTAGHSATTASGKFDAVTVADNTNYKITAKATYGDGAIPKTNIGNDYAAGQIKAGSKSATSGAITGYRNSFYGTLAEKATVNSAAVRGLTGKSNKALANGAKFNVTIPVGALRVVIAYPATLRDVTSIADVNGMNAEIKSSFTKTTVAVEGANGATAIDYKVYTLDFANANDTANTYAVTI